MWIMIRIPSGSGLWLRIGPTSDGRVGRDERSVETSKRSSDQGKRGGSTATRGDDPATRRPRIFHAGARRGRTYARPSTRAARPTTRGPRKLVASRVVARDSRRRTVVASAPQMANKARFFAALLAIAGLGVSAGSLPACSSGNEQTIARPCPPGQSCQVSLTLLHTADIHSRLYPYEQAITQVDATLGLGDLNTVANVGGIARLGYVLNRERARSDRVLHLDSGDCFQGAPIFNFFSGEPEVRALSALGTDAAVVGNHEFDRGEQNLATQMQRWANFPLLAANYDFDQAAQDYPSFGRLGTITNPFTVLNTGGLKVAVIGMGNLSSLTSIFDQPNKVGITPINTVEIAQFYVDLLRPYVDVIVMLSHLGLDVDQRMVRGTTGIDVVLGGHNHIVINPPQEIRDCSADPNNPGFVWAVDPNAKIDPGATPPDDADPALKGPAGSLDPINHPFAFKRACRPRRVVIAHSGAFSKYLGRMDLVLTNDPALASPDGDPTHYDPVNGFEVLEQKYIAYPITATTPEDPVIKDMLQPYQRVLDNVADLELLVGYSPQGAKRIATQGGDSPLGNVVGNAIWLRLGIQTDFSLTNSTGIRTDLNPGPVTIEQMYNIFPFDNSITKMQLSGLEVQELFDFAARRSAARGCASQIQIAGARVRLNCAGCQSISNVPCEKDDDCASINGTCKLDQKLCLASSCAEAVYIGHTEKTCAGDADCADPGQPPPPGSCDKAQGAASGRCLSLIKPTNLYELATSNYLAGGGSGFRVLQRNTTQVDTKIQQRDALIDYLRAGKPCGYDPANGTPDGLKACSTDADCGDTTLACACPGHVKEQGDPVTCVSDGACTGGAGRCVRKDCRDDVAQFRAKRCKDAPDIAACRAPIGACQLAGEECKILACIDPSIGAVSDNRVEMIGR
jgi:5'-nucleotidase/UDP-sugar diphosphatase